MPDWVLRATEDSCLCVGRAGQRQIHSGIHKEPAEAFWYGNLWVNQTLLVRINNASCLNQQPFSTSYATQSVLLRLTQSFRDTDIFLSSVCCHHLQHVASKVFAGGDKRGKSYLGDFEGRFFGNGICHFRPHSAGQNSVVHGPNVIGRGLRNVA